VFIAVLLLGGGSTRYTLTFANAGQLVPGNEVRVGGRRIGAIEEIELTDDNAAAVRVDIDDEFAPLRRGTRAVIRSTSLSSVAARYVVLTPGPNDAEPLEEGDVVPAAQTTSIVDIDQLFNTFDERTRRGLRRLVRGSATQFAGRGQQAGEAAEYFNPALASTRRLVAEVNRDSRTLARFLVDTGRAMGALAERRDTLTELVSNGRDAAAGVAEADAALDTSLERLPATLRRGNSTFVNLRSTLTDLDALTEASLPNTRRFAELLRELRPLVADARPTIRDLSLAFRRAGAGNDLTELLRRAPRLTQVARPSLRATTRALRRSDDVLAFFRAYAPELTQTLRDFGNATTNYDANGHFARVQPIFNLFDFTDDPAGGTLTLKESLDTRLEGLDAGNLRRCPGGASEPAADGSAPWRGEQGELDCDPAASVGVP
jgi:phospholipid/cholesterol/gamma-HCH transport system substrate-binding protein